MTPGSRRLAALAVVVAALACRDRDRPATPPPELPPAAPAGFTIEATESWGRYVLAWTPPGDAFDGYQIETATDDGPFGIAHDGLFPRSETGAVLTDWDDPELAWIHVRIRAVRGALASPWTDVVSARQALRAPLQVDAQPTGLPYDAVPPIHVSWMLPQDAVAIAAPLVLERAEAPPGEQGWITLPLAAGATSYDDADVEDGRSYVYRLHRAADGVASPPVTSNPNYALSVLAPAEVTVTLLGEPGAEPTGFRVAWKNRSATADTCTVRRSDGGPDWSAPLAGPFDDLAWPQWPGASYEVRASRTATLASSGVSARVDAPGFTRRGALVLDATAPTVPAGQRYLRDAAGGIHVLRASTWGQRGSVFRPTADGHEEHALPGVYQSLIAPGLTLDPEGHPHVAYVLAPVEGGPRTVRHVWHDGVAWQSEDVALDGPQDWPYAFAVGTGGGLHFVYSRWGTPAVQVHASRDGAGWTRTVIPGVTDTFGAPVLQAAPDGTLYLAPVRTDGDGTFRYATRPRGEAWTTVTSPALWPWADVWFSGGNGGTAGLFFLKLPAAPQQQLWYVRRDGGAFAEPALVATAPWIGAELRASLVMTADGSRSLLTVNLPDDAGVPHEELFVRGAAEGWRRMRLGSGGSFPAFGPGGEAWVLGPVRTLGADTVRLPLLAEPPGT